MTDKSKLVRHLDPEMLDRFRRGLAALYHRIRPDAAALEEHARSPSGGQGVGELTNAPMHLADAGSSEFGQELDATLLENEEFLAAEIVAALDRIALGTFGNCEQCGTAIKLERLKALPYTRYCVSCSAELHDGRNVNLNEGRARTAPSLAPNVAEDPAERLARSDDDRRPSRRDDDVHAAETPGGGSASGGLAGSNEGRGDPDLDRLQSEGGSGESELRADRETDDDHYPQSGKSGGAVGGTPVGKRSARE